MQYQNAIFFNTHNILQTLKTIRNTDFSMSSRKFDNVIVFGPTGTVGGITALEAHKRGAHVWLAMRDPSKTIPDIPSDVEKSGKFSRVQADLTDPTSVTKAIQESGAKAAYVYLIHGAKDHSRGALQALHDAGVESVVFLSTYYAQQDVDLRSITSDTFIPWAHAQVELAAGEIGFPYFTALRPAQFASNPFKNFLDRTTKPFKALYIYPDATTDNIAPEDIGAVSAAVLVERPHAGTEAIYLAGPEIKTAAQTWELVKKVSGREDIDTTPLSKEDFAQRLAAHRLPPPLIDNLLKNQDDTLDRSYYYEDSVYRPAVENIKKYTGREATKFEDYLEAHKAEWQSL